MLNRVVCDTLCRCHLLVRHWTIAGALDPVRSLTGLTDLYLAKNALIGMCSFTSVYFVLSGTCVQVRSHTLKGVLYFNNESFFVC